MKALTNIIQFGTDTMLAGLFLTIVLFAFVMGLNLSPEAYLDTQVVANPNQILGQSAMSDKTFEVLPVETESFRLQETFQNREKLELNLQVLQNIDKATVIKLASISKSFDNDNLFVNIVITSADTYELSAQLMLGETTNSLYTSKANADFFASFDFELSQNKGQSDLYLIITQADVVSPMDVVVSVGL